MEINSYLDEMIKKWLEEIVSLDQFWYDIEPDYYEEPDIPEKELVIIIRDNKGNKMWMCTPLDSVNNPRILFFNKDLNLEIKYEGDVSICDSIRKIIKKFPDTLN